MEENLDFRSIVENVFQVTPAPIETYSPLALAYIGDSIYDAIVKTMVVEKGNRSANALHKTVTALVNAEVQSKISNYLKDILTEEETDVFKRGRNAKSFSTAKNAAVTDYRRATGLEALVGYLYLTGRVNRAVELVYTGLSGLGLLE